MNKLRSGMMKKVVSILLVLSAVVSLTACGGSSAETSSSGVDEGTPVVSEELKVGLNGDPATLDPLMTTGAITRDCNRYIYEGLFEMNANYEPELQLASDYKVNSDYTEFTFNLRQGVKFHNGKEMTADDVVASLNRCLSKNSAVKSLITGGEQFEKVDNYTVKILLTNPCYTLPAAMCAPAQFAAIMPKEVVEAATNDKGVSEYIGTGPMKYVEWKQNQYLLLEKNNDYQPPRDTLDGEAGNKTVYFNKVYLYFVTDSTIRTAGIQSGEYDIVSGVSYDDVSMLQSNANVKLDKSLLGYGAVIFNKADGILAQNETLRAAITYAVDCDQLIKAAYPAEGYYETSSSMMPTGSKWYTKAGTDAVNAKDMTKAKELLTQSGYNGETIKVITNQTYSQHYNATLVLVQQLEQLGLNVDLEVVDWTTMLEYKKTHGTYDLYFVDYPAVTTPTSLRTISQTDEGWTTWPEFFSLLNKVTSATSDDEAVKAWEECHKYLFTHYSFIPVGYSYYCNAASSSIHNYHAISCQSIFGCWKS